MEREFKAKFYNIIIRALARSFFVICSVYLLIDVTKDFQYTAQDWLAVTMCMFLILIFLGLLYLHLFKHVRVVCTSDELIVFRGKAVASRANYDSTKFKYSVERHKYKYRCYLGYTELGGKQRYTDFAVLGRKQFLEICNILNNHDALDLDNCKSDTKWFKVER
ncbi:hypothetical protein RZE82_02095 [Mollicutes bacterium LVI A0039]|nr:hypothetical protein RZE82_02095 [Mollicutes bacterium LVI A0039]